jgi:hypothetical protein
MNVCQHCHEPSSQPVCDACLKRFTTDLNSLVIGLPILRSLAAKKSRVIGKQSGGGMRTIAPIPLNIGAWQLLQDITKYATSLMVALRLPYRRFDEETMLKGVMHQVTKLASRPDIEQIMDLAHQAVHKMVRQFTPPPEKTMIGSCPECGADVWCDDADVESGWTVCKCGDTLKVRDVQQLRVLRLASCGARGTAAELCRFLKPCGVTIRRKTVSEWKRRGIIAPVTVDQDGLPVYLLWDVWQAFTR